MTIAAQNVAIQYIHWAPVRNVTNFERIVGMQLFDFTLNFVDLIFAESQITLNCLGTSSKEVSLTPAFASQLTMHDTRIFFENFHFIYKCKSHIITGSFTCFLTTQLNFLMRFARNR
jgi:hypothetical protein